MASIMDIVFDYRLGFVHNKDSKTQIQGGKNEESGVANYSLRRKINMVKIGRAHV